MIAELNAAFQSLNVLNNWVQAHRTLRNFNELSSAVAEVYSKLLTAQDAALAAQKEQAALAQRVGVLEAEIAQLKDWNREAERYQLTEIAPSILAYRVKPGKESGEPAHTLCPNCFTKREKSILQADTPDPQVYTYCCSRCQSKLPVATRPMTIPTLRR